MSAAPAPHPAVPKVTMTYDFRISVDFPVYVTSEAAREGLDLSDSPEELVEAVFGALVRSHEAGQMAELLRRDLVDVLARSMGQHGITVETVSFDTVPQS